MKNLKRKKELSKMEKANILSKLSKLTEENNMILESDFDIVKYANMLGFSVYSKVLDDDTDGWILINENENQKIICVNKNRSYGTIRFIIAHELGHYFLNFNNGKMYAHREKKQYKENESDADFFAANLLMQKDQFISAFKSVNELIKNNYITKFKGIDILAKTFGVDLKAVEKRIDELKLTYES